MTVESTPIGGLDHAILAELRREGRISWRELGERVGLGPTATADRVRRLESIGLIRGGRALALLRGRNYLTPQDVFDVAPEILRHRLLLSYEALAQDVDVEQVLNRVLSTVPAPRVSPSQPGTAPDPYLGVASDAGAWGA